MRPVNPLAGVLAEAWAMYKAHASHLLSIAFVVYLLTAVVEAVFTGLLGVVGALLAIPTAAAILLITREVFIRRQDAR